MNNLDILLTNTKTNEVFALYHKYTVSTLSDPISEVLAKKLFRIGHCVTIPEKDLSIFFNLSLESIGSRTNVSDKTILDINLETEVMIEINRYITDLFVEHLEHYKHKEDYLLQLYEASTNLKELCSGITPILDVMISNNIINEATKIEILKNQKNKTELSANIDQQLKKVLLNEYSNY